MWGRGLCYLPLKDFDPPYPLLTNCEKPFAAGVGSSPTLSIVMNQLSENWFLGNLFAGVLGAAISILLPRLFTKGLVLMSTIIIIMSLGACGELVYMVAQFKYGPGTQTLPSNRTVFLFQTTCVLCSLKL
jgi:hypothetical protein